MKYMPTFPDRFGGYTDASTWARDFFPWYNMEHRHSGIALMTPWSVHSGQAAAISEARSATLLDAARKRPERFVNGDPTPLALPEEVWINPPSFNPKGEQESVVAV